MPAEDLGVEAAEDEDSLSIMALERHENTSTGKTNGALCIHRAPAKE